VPGGPGHGPYWFGYYWDYQQRTKSFYLGKHLPAGVELIGEGDDAQAGVSALESAQAPRSS
jgi:hypothetical protein